MKLLNGITIAAVALTLAACGEKENKTVDRGFDSKNLTQLRAGIWVDPNGCDHWIIDDGVEGYLSARIDKYGKPVCSAAAPPSTAIGPFKQGSTFPDSI